MSILVYMLNDTCVIIISYKFCAILQDKKPIMLNYLEYERGENHRFEVLRNTSCIFLITLILLLLLFQGKGLSQYFIPQVSLQVSLTIRIPIIYLCLPVLAEYCKFQYNCANDMFNFFNSSR